MAIYWESILIPFLRSAYIYLFILTSKLCSNIGIVIFSRVCMLKDVNLPEVTGQEEKNKARNMHPGLADSSDNCPLAGKD